jgi:hypothetical protein
VLGRLFDRHHLAELVDVLGQAEGDPKIGVEQSQVFGDNALAVKAEDLAILTREPHPGRGQIEIPHRSFGPAVDMEGLLTAKMANGMKPSVGSDFDMGRFLDQGFVDNSDSREGEIGYYTQIGHRRPPWDFFLARKQEYNPLEIPDVHSYLFS